MAASKRGIYCNISPGHEGLILDAPLNRHTCHPVTLTKRTHKYRDIYLSGKKDYEMSARDETLEDWETQRTAHEHRRSNRTRCQMTVRQLRQMQAYKL